MAKQRMINTKFWSDGFIREHLNPLDRYLFLYFLTNEKTNISGVYELPLSTMSSETGIERDTIKKMLPRFKTKIYYIDGWVYIRNFQKHQSTSSSTVKRGIEIEMDRIPSNIKDKIEEIEKKLDGMDRVSGAIIYPNTNSNLNSNPNYIGHGEFKNVFLTDEEEKKLIIKFGEKNTGILIEELSGYMASKKKKYDNHYATLGNWGRKKIGDHQSKLQTKGKTFVT